MEDDSSNLANVVASAIATVLDWTSTPDARIAAVSYLETIKAGDVRVLANTSFILAKKDWSSEIRLHAFKMLQHLVRLRWEELSPTECRSFANLAIEFMSVAADPCEEWALKSQTAALVAEMVRREGLNLWQELFPTLISLSSKGPIQAELVSMTLRWIPEDITVHNEDLEGDRRRTLLRGLTQSLPEILPLLYTLLDRHFGAAISEAGRQQLDTAKQHASAVTSTLNAVNAYAEWAPLSDLASYGIINGCGFLLSSPDFRFHACEFFKLVTPRKRPVDGSAAEFDSAMEHIVKTLMNISREFLDKTRVTGVIDESEYEFAEYICESMVSLGSSNLQCIASDATLLSVYMQQMLGFFRHYKLAIHFHSLTFWLALMKEVMSKPKVAVQSAEESLVLSVSSAGEIMQEKEKILNIVNDEFVSVILDTLFPRMLKREKVLPETVTSLGAMELWSDDFEGRGEFSVYRSKLLELSRYISSYKPQIAAAKVSERIITVVKNAQDLSVMESMHMALLNIASAVFDEAELGKASAKVQLELRAIFEGLLQHLLSVNWAEPPLVEVLGHYLSSLGPYLKYFPDAVGSVITKLFQLLSSLPFTLKDTQSLNARHARLQICSSFIRIAKAADKSILPHVKVWAIFLCVEYEIICLERSIIVLRFRSVSVPSGCKGIAETITRLQKEGCLLRGEHNLLGEAFLIMASAAGMQQQQDVLAWLLEPVSQQWLQSEWQAKFLSDPLGLVQLCSETTVMWSIFHTVTFFEKALKRSGGTKKANLNFQNSSGTSSSPLHPMTPHISWMLPPLLKLLRSIHYLWSPSISEVLPGELKAAMVISDVEQFSLLGEGHSKLSRNAVSFADGPHLDTKKEAYAEPNESDIRNWLKGIRDSAYNVLGLSTTIGDSFFKALDAQSFTVAVVENIHSIEFRHMRQLVHSVITPLVKNCPPEMWEVWLEKLLHPLFHHAHQVLNCSWTSLLLEGRAKVPDVHGIFSRSDLKLEVMEEKLLRDLTREICSLLSVIASPSLNVGLPSIEQSSRPEDISSPKILETFASSSMVCFLLRHKDIAIPALRICVEAFTWTDGDAVTKISSFCSPLLVLAVVTNNVELREFVAREVFSSVIQSLTLESNAIVSSDLVGLCREIFVYLRDRSPAPRQVLLSLPCITPQDVHAFEEALTKTSSAKEQKQHMRSLLLLATGNKLKALTAQKTVNIITNVSIKPRNRVNPSDSKAEEGEVIGLATII